MIRYKPHGVLALFASKASLAPVLVVSFWSLTHLPGWGSYLHKQVIETRMATSPVTVVDSSEMTQFGDSVYINGLSAKHRVGRFSPNGKQFVVVLKKGNLRRNTNDYSLLLFLTAEALRTPPPRPRVIASFSSTSNRPAIQQVTWLDNVTLAFLGETPGEKQQLYTLNITARKLQRLSNHSTSLTSYAIAPDREQFFFAAEPATDKLLTEQVRREGINISHQLLSNLIAGDNRFEKYKRELFCKARNSNKERRIRAGGMLLEPAELSLSPDGNQLLVRASIVDIPQKWAEHENRILRLWMGKNGKGDLSFIYQYVLINTHTRKSRMLIDAPLAVAGGAGGAWSADGHSVVIAGTYLPLDVSDPSERTARRLGTYVAEIRLPGREVVPITQGEMKLAKWDQQQSKIVLMSTEEFSTVDVDGTLVGYQKTHSGWNKVSATADELTANAQLQLTLEEDLNQAPRIVALNLASGQKSVLMDLNPQFKNLTFARVEEIAFTTPDGRKFKGGLYRPPDHVREKRYPLLIQTHGWNPQRFWIDGPYSSAFAAQPLASKGIAVLQLEENMQEFSTPREAPLEMSDYEAAIDSLDGMGVIDRSHVGVIGFSRTGFVVKYALTHSRYKFAAATVADGVATGYFNYLAVLNAWPPIASDFEATNGSTPFGDGLILWLQRSPGFRLDKVHAPVRIEAYGPSGLFMSWEFFSGLLRQGKPVDFVYLPAAEHVVVKPWERMTSQQGNVDWFCFWLKGEEDPDPTKTNQYARWRELRKTTAPE